MDKTLCSLFWYHMSRSEWSNKIKIHIFFTFQQKKIVLTWLLSCCSMFDLSGKPLIIWIMLMGLRWLHSPSYVVIIIRLLKNVCKIFFYLLFNKEKFISRHFIAGSFAFNEFAVNLDVVWNSRLEPASFPVFG